MNDRCIILFIDPRNGQTFYIVNGTKDLVEVYFSLLDDYIGCIEFGLEITKEEWRRCDLDLIQFMKEIRDEGYEPVLHVLLEDLSIDAAYAIEEYLIKMTGRRNISHGNLINKYPSSKYGHWKYLYLPQSEKTTYEEMRDKYPEVMDVYYNWGFIHNDLFEKYCVEKERVYQESAKLFEN